MAKKRRKIAKPQYVAKEIRARQAPKKGVPKELKFGLVFCIIALIVAVVLFVTLYSDGSLPIRDGNVVAEQNWLVANKGTVSSPKYYKIGEINTLPGFRLDYGGVDSSNTLIYYHNFFPEDESGRVANYQVIVQNGKASDVVNYVHEMLSSYSGVGDLKSANYHDHRFSYFILNGELPAQENAEGEPPDQQMQIYMDGPRDTTVEIRIGIRVTWEEPPISEEELLAIADEVLHSISLN